jgi:hypothetical protein
MSEQDGKAMQGLLSDIESGLMPLDQRLKDMGIDPAEYKAYGRPRRSQ